MQGPDGFTARLSISNNVLNGIFVDSDIVRMDLENAVRQFCEKTGVKIPGNIDILGSITPKNTWTAEKYR